MAFIEKILVYFIIALGIIIFLSLSSRISLLNRIFIALIAVVVLLLVLFLISSIITIVIVIVLAVVLLSFLQNARTKIRRFFNK